MKIVHFEKMDLNGLSLNLLILLECRLLRGREGSGLLVHALILLLLPHFTFCPLYFSILPIFLLIPLFPFFFLISRCFLSYYFFSSLVFLGSLLASHCSFSSSCLLPSLVHYAQLRCHAPNPIPGFVTMTGMLISSLNLILTRTNLNFYKTFPKASLFIFRIILLFLYFLISLFN